MLFLYKAFQGIIRAGILGTMPEQTKGQPEKAGKNLMATLLELIVSEWNMVITFALILIIDNGGGDSIAAIPERYQPRADGESLWQYIWVKWRNRLPILKPLPEGYYLFWKSVGYYRLFLIIIWLHIYHLGTLLAQIFLERSPSLALAGWIAFGVCILYSLFFIRAWRKFIALKPNGLRVMLACLATYPFFGVAVSVTCFYYLSFWEGIPFSFQPYSREWGYVHFWGACIIAVSWLVYFLVSRKTRQLWYRLEKEWNGGN